MDTNILIDYLSGIELARVEMQRYQRNFISTITWMEVMAGTTPADELAVRRFLQRFRWVSLDQGIAEIAVELRKEKRIKLPDAIIWASAIKLDALLVTRNSKDFPANDPSVRIPYRLGD